MHTISFTKEALNITIRNQYPDLTLISPAYFNVGTACCVPPSQQIDTGDIMEASFGVDAKEEYFKGVLLYKLQRKHATSMDNRLNPSMTEDTNIYLLMIWNSIIHDQGSCLVEYAGHFTWNEEKLWALYQQYEDQFISDGKSNMITWFMHDSIVLKIRFDVTYESDCKLDITISEGTRKYDMKKTNEN
jgi:hypothetical protein